jgi:acyl-CoA thioesterase-1
MKIQKLILVLFGIVCFGQIAVEGKAQTRILPLGDSVTSSFGPNSSYRYWLWQHLVQAGYDVDFVGTQYGVASGTPANADFDQDHEGHPGWTTQDAVFSINQIAGATVPDVVLLDLGGNDFGKGISPDQSMTNLMTIIESLRAVNPDVVVLLAQTTPFAGQDKRGRSLLRRAVKQAAKLQKKAGARVVIVNLASSFNVRKDTTDGAHPNETGERKIAKRYFSALRKVL